MVIARYAWKLATRRAGIQRQHHIDSGGRLEQLATTAEDFIERVLKVRRSLGRLSPNLLKILLVAFLDIFAKELS